ncbi:MAG: hypothetical protein HY908_32220 [Myxococcales bacterium]|nr:hypothetical protein [Myxococcales bacterium]
MSRGLRPRVPRLPSRAAGRTTRRALVAGGLALGVLGSAACTAVLGIDDIEFGPPASGSGGQSSGGQSAGGGGQSAGGQNTGGAGAEGGAGGAEHCGNGVDDDGNLLADCADPACSCVPPPPAGWSDPFAFFPNGSAQLFPGCGAAYPTETAAGQFVFGAPATCTTCACTTPSGGTCGMPSVQPFGGGSCGGPQAPFTMGTDETCEQHLVQPGTDSIRVSSPAASGGSCSASGGAPTVPDPFWSGAAFVCDTDDATGQCGGGADVCVSAIAAPFKACVRIAGSTPCPAGPYSEAHQLVLGYTDDRSCSACGCGSPAGRSCPGTLDLFQDAICLMPTFTVPADGSCFQVQAPDLAAMIYHQPPNGPTGGLCAATGGTPTGSLTPGPTHTVCCVP